MLKDIIYFDKPGKENTIETLKAARNRAAELGIRHMLVASTHGYTALTAAEIFKDTGIEIIAVGISNSFAAEGWNMNTDERLKMEKQGIKVLVSLHGLEAGVTEAFTGSYSPGSIVADTLRCFSQGMKVAVEITIMAAEAGLISTNRDVIAVAGSGEGADTAVVLKPAYAREFKKLKIRETIAKPYI
jgi:hypothetical protein